MCVLACTKMFLKWSWWWDFTINSEMAFNLVDNFSCRVHFCHIYVQWCRPMYIIRNNGPCFFIKCITVYFSSEICETLKIQVLSWR